MSEEKETQEETSVQESIGEIASKFNIEEEAADFKAKPQQQQYQPQQYQPQPEPNSAEDLERFRNDVRQTLYSINERLTKQDQERIQNHEEADLRAAVKALKEGNDALDDETVEVYLGVKARKDKALLNIWKQRDKKPEAWSAALNHLKQDISKKFSVRSDPQLAENQRAMKVSRDQMATGKKSDPNEKYAKMNETEFDRAWSQLVQGG